MLWVVSLTLDLSRLTPSVYLFSYLSIYLSIYLFLFINLLICLFEDKALSGVTVRKGEAGRAAPFGVSVLEGEVYTPTTCQPVL